MGRKPFDCVAVKDAIQAKLRQKQEGLSDEQVLRRRRQWLETSDDPVARWWRSLPGTPLAPHPPGHVTP